MSDQRRLTSKIEAARAKGWAAYFAEVRAVARAAAEERLRFAEAYYATAPPLPPVRVVGRGWGLPDMRRRR